MRTLDEQQAFDNKRGSQVAKPTAMAPASFHTAERNKNLREGGQSAVWEASRRERKRTAPRLSLKANSPASQFVSRMAGTPTLRKHLKHSDRVSGEISDAEEQAGDVARSGHAFTESAWLEQSRDKLPVERVPSEHGRTSTGTFRAKAGEVELKGAGKSAGMQHSVEDRSA